MHDDRAVRAAPADRTATVRAMERTESDDTTATQPGRGASITRALRRRCPVCGSKAISRHPAHVLVVCPNCGLSLERQVGSFIGGVGLNTITAFAALLVVIVGGFIATGGEASVTRILLPALAVSLIVPLFFYARSRLLWVALELIWWPLEPGETSEVR